MAVPLEELHLWLVNTTSPDEAVRVPATRALESAELLPGFAACLLVSCTGGDEVQRVAAATYLKNFIRAQWPQKSKIAPEERLELRRKLVEVLLRADATVLKQLVEAFRIVASRDFSGETNTWDELVPGLQRALQSSDLLNGVDPPHKTLNVLLAIQAITKPYQYFLNPTVAKEPVPLLLEIIAKELLVPLQGLFHHLVEQARSSHEHGLQKKHDEALIVITKCFQLAVGSHMPATLLPFLGIWVEDVTALLGMVDVKNNISEPLSKLKLWKRCLQLCSTLITRHRKHLDKFIPALTNAALRILEDSKSNNELHEIQERIISLAFDLLSNILESGPGWRILSPKFSYLLENVVFPTLELKQKDIVEWNDDEDEYIRKNLPSDLNDSCTLKDDDLLTPRRSALNFLGLVASAKGPPTAGNPKKTAATKRKKGKNKENRGTAGELLVIPFLARYSLPPDGPFFEATVSYYGVLLAYGALQEFLKSQSPEYVEMILTSRVFPLYSMASPSPYLLANANWLLGELAPCLPEGLKSLVYDSLLKALNADNIGGVSWRPVRASAAAAISTLVEEDYKPGKWFPLFHGIISTIRNSVEEAAHALQLLTTCAESGDEDIAVHVPYLVASVKDEISKCIPSPPEPWPQVVELGFSSVAALAHLWDSAEPEESKKKGEPLKSWNEGCTTIVNSYSELLQRAWICVNKEDQCSDQARPDPLYLNDTSVILGYLVKYTSEPTDLARLRIEQLLRVWTELISYYNAWDEEEDLAIFDAVEEVVALNERCPMQQYFVAEAPSPPAPPLPVRSFLEGMAAFVTSAMHSAYSAATWRACRISHCLLHSTALAFEAEHAASLLVSRFTEAAYRRLSQLSSTTVPLAKPLSLVIASCYVGLPGTVEGVFSRSDGDGSALVLWAKALSTLASGDADPGLVLESELKLGVFCLLKLAERLVGDKSAEEVAQKCFESALDASVRLKDAEETGEGPDEDEKENDEDTDDNTGDDSDADSDEEEEEVEETEEEFLDRYAETARELEEEALDDVEGGAEEDGHEIELGVLALADQEKCLLACLEKCGQAMKGRISVEVLSSFVAKFPQFRCLLS